MDPALIVALTGAVTGIGALILNRQSQKETRENEKAAASIKAQGTRLEETQQALDSQERQIVRLEAAEDKARQRAEKAEEALDEERQLHRHMVAAQESRCREVTAQITEALVLLRGVVTDEIAKAAAEDALKAPAHPHDVPPTGGEGKEEEG